MTRDLPWVVEERRDGQGWRAVQPLFSPAETKLFWLIFAGGALGVVTACLALYIVTALTGWAL